MENLFSTLYYIEKIKNYVPRFQQPYDMKYDILRLYDIMYDIRYTSMISYSNLRLPVWPGSVVWRSGERMLEAVRCR